MNALLGAVPLEQHPVYRFLDKRLAREGAWIRFVDQLRDRAVAARTRQRVELAVEDEAESDPGFLTGLSSVIDEVESLSPRRPGYAYGSQASITRTVGSCARPSSRLAPL